MRKHSAQSLAYGRGPPGVGAAFIPKTLGALGLGVETRASAKQGQTSSSPRNCGPGWPLGCSEHTAPLWVEEGTSLFTCDGRGRR